MSLDVYFRRDIANVLRATECASEGASGALLRELAKDRPAKQGAIPSDAERLTEAYRRGVRHALVSVGLAFGLEPQVDETDLLEVTWTAKEPG